MWLDNASDIDILFYEPYARIIADIAKNEQYNPLTVGVFGLWGAGKSTLLKLIGEKLKSQDGIICVTINAWMFESYDDAKTAIMEALLQELKEEVPVEETKKKLGKLIKRVDWFKLGTKAISTLAPVVASVATGNPLPMLLNVTGSAEEIGNTVKNAANSIQSLKDEYWKEEDASNDESTINNIRKFREEFSDALKSDDIKNVVVMIDDLDRCRPERIIEILEVIKLFLSVDRTTFIIAADENVIKYSIREKYPPMNGFDVELDKEYIEKIIQLPIYIPELSAKDIQNYLLLLVTQSYLEQESFKHLIDKIFEEKRTISGDVITLEEINKSIGELGLNWQDGGQTAFNETAKIIDEIREIVASTLKGNPRQAKRFLNTFITKRQLAKIYYGDEIDISILAKLLVLQKLDNDLFIQLNEWNKEFDTENKEFKEIRTKVMEGNVDAQNPWNTSQIKKWLECKPVELEKYRLEKYFYLTRENLKRSSIDESGFSKNTKEILERIGRAKSGQMVAIIKDMEKLRAEEIADTFKVVVSKIEKGARRREYVGTVDWLISAGIVNVCYCMDAPELPLKGNYNPDNFKLYFSDTGLLIGSLDEEAQEDLRANKNFNTYKGAIYENIIGEMLVKQGYDLYFYRNEKGSLEMDFFVRDSDSLVPVEVKADDGTTISLNNLIDKHKYSDVKYGIKLGNKNIGYNGKFYTFPYFLAFLLKRFLRENNKR